MIGRVLCVGGTFDEAGGHASKVFRRMVDGMGIVADIQNGGCVSDLKGLVELVKLYEVVVWMPNVSNDVDEKHIKQIKQLNQSCILVSSKRNDFDQYSLADIVQHALDRKSNLFVEINQRPVGPGGKPMWHGTLLDPLGNQFVSTLDWASLGAVIRHRVEQLRSFTRVGSVRVEGDVPDALDIVSRQQTFLDVVRRSAEVFSGLVPVASENKRFLGNASFRCQRGFPSFRSDDDLIFVSRRNIDKAFIDASGFVPVKAATLPVQFYGDKKPSVDSPIHVKLYEKLPHVRYMLHGHVYVKGAPLTSDLIPCGSLEEADAIVELAPSSGTDFAINLRGHGSIILASTPLAFDAFEFISRPEREMV